MLKSEMQEHISAMSDQLLDYEAEIRDLKKELKVIHDLKAENKRLNKKIDKVRTACDAIISVNCSEEVPPDMRYRIMEDAEMSGKDNPNFPPLSKLYSAIAHIQAILYKFDGSQIRGNDQFGL